MLLVMSEEGAAAAGKMQKILFFQILASLAPLIQKRLAKIHSLNFKLKAQDDNKDYLC